MVKSSFPSVLKPDLKPEQKSGETPNRTQTIALNSLWYGSETIAGFVLLFATSIPLARIMGPEKLGYFNYVAWLTGMSAAVGGLGLPGMASKFIAEHLGRGENGVVRAIFFFALRLQIVLSSLVTGLGLTAFLVWGDPQYRLVSALQVLSVFPAMIAAIPSMTNYAQERMQANFAGSMASSAIYLVGVLMSLWLGWGLAGVAASLLASRTIELVIRIVPCIARIKTFPQGQISPDLRRQMVGFSTRQIALLLLGLVVWDRSDVVILKMRAHDLKQITFFSIVFNLVDKLLLVPRVFSGAVSATVFVQYGRDKAKLKELTLAGTRYMLLMGVPLLMGLALVGQPLIQVMYGAQYRPAVPVIVIAAVFAILKSVLDPANSVLSANNRQGPAVIFAVISAALNIGLDWWLTPAHGAIGAAIGNGVAQSALVVSYWGLCMVLFDIPFDFRSAGKILLASGTMAVPVLLCNRFLPPLAALSAGIPAGAAVFVVMLGVTSFFKTEDYERLGHLGKLLPGVLQPRYRVVLGLLIPSPPAADSAMAGTGATSA
jgi:O-antigen/teichoic acid export membrane protein